MAVNMKGKLWTGGCVFGGGFICLFALTFFSFFLLFLVGCEGQQAVDGGRDLPMDARKAEALRALEQNFESPQAHFNMGQIYQAEGLTEKAEYHYNVALSFDPAHVQAQAAMVKLFVTSSNPTKGKTYADLYMNRVSSMPGQSLRLAKAFQDEQLDDYALMCYEQALRVAPDSARVNKEFAFYYLQKGDQAKAKEYLVRSFQFDPSQPDVANELGKLGVEVRIPKEPDTERTTTSLGQNDDREWRIVAKHGLIQVEPIVQKGGKKEKKEDQ
ncbi:MAG: hypothetical protein JXM79_06690 [Sedimentisphaerales bacterium]|nr:hypothetical protein [Sedimentisphaerales bacterium]